MTPRLAWPFCLVDGRRAYFLFAVSRLLVYAENVRSSSSDACTIVIVAACGFRETAYIRSRRCKCLQNGFSVADSRTNRNLASSTNSRVARAVLWRLHCFCTLSSAFLTVFPYTVCSSGDANMPGPKARCLQACLNLSLPSSRLGSVLQGFLPSEASTTVFLRAPPGLVTWSSLERFNVAAP